MKEKYSEKYWEKGYRSLSLFKDDMKDPINKTIRKFFANGEGKTCFEVGCYPGRYLAHFGELNFELHGIDLYPGVMSELPNWLKDQGHKTGLFHCTDFTSFQSPQKYDVVCSFGFIEHFSDYHKIIEIKTHLVKPGGYILITTPNFSGGIQRFFHNLFDRKNMEEHNISAMDPKEWQRIVKIHGFETIYAGNFGGIMFWVNEYPKNILSRLFVKTMIRVGKILNPILPDSRLYSGYSGIIARKL
jgi:2-polyprenyl-3-methyl-5-hydroxy-6-metoxy-1,4-benzoquinol methylase